MELTVSASEWKIDFPVLWMENNKISNRITLILKAREFENKIYQILPNHCPNSLTMSHPLAITMETLRCHVEKHTSWENVSNGMASTYSDKKIEDSPQKHVVNALKWTFYDIECFHFAIRLLFLVRAFRSTEKLNKIQMTNKYDSIRLFIDFIT